MCGVFFSSVVMAPGVWRGGSHSRAAFPPVHSSQPLCQVAVHWPGHILAFLSSLPHILIHCFALCLRQHMKAKDWRVHWGTTRLAVDTPLPDYEVIDFLSSNVGLNLHSISRRISCYLVILYCEKSYGASKLDRRAGSHVLRAAGT